jgi:CubicO group peptidase (beta-lactamase class C family)
MSLDDEVAKFLPEFADIKVSVTDAEGKKSLVPPKRPLTIRDLVTHTSGSRFSPPIIKRAVPLREIARQMAAVPLVAQPGETFCYGNAWVDASAAALEVAVGMPYEKWLKERVLDPLGMGDTTFSPTAEQASRIVRAYTTDDGPLRLGSDWCTPQLVFPWEAKVFPCAAGGLFSTPADMMRFSQMLAHHGTWKGRKIISRETFDKVFAVKQTPPCIAEPYCVGSWLYDDWLGHEGAMRTDQRANLKTGHSRLFFIQTENRGGPAFFSLKKKWNAACDAVQGTPPFNPKN